MGGGLRARPTALLVPSQLLALPDYVDQPALVSGLRRPAVWGSFHPVGSPPPGLFYKGNPPPEGGGRCGGGSHSPRPCGPPAPPPPAFARRSPPHPVAILR